MAGLFNKIVNSMKLDDDYEEEFEPDEEFDDLDYADEPSTPVKKPITRTSAPKKTYDSTLDLDDDEEDYTPKKTFRPIRSKQQSNVMPMRKTGNMEVRMCRPATLSDAKDVVDVLLSGKAVVMNMEGINLDMAQRIIDFSSGACYSMDGNLESISKYIFIISPSNIDLTGDFAGTLGGGSDSLNFNI